MLGLSVLRLNSCTRFSRNDNFRKLSIARTNQYQMSENHTNMQCFNGNEIWIAQKYRISPDEGNRFLKYKICFPISNVECL